MSTTSPPFTGLTRFTTATEITAEQAVRLFDRAEWMIEQPRAGLTGLLEGRILGNLFYQNSTRTRLSFDAAMRRLGGSAIGFDDVRTTRAGDFFAESLTDTVRVIGQYVDCIVLRHPDDGAAARAAEVSPVPVINAGDGANEHPTQALMDLGMLRRVLGGSIEGARIGLVGDPSCRILRSMLYLVPIFKVAEVLFLLPPETAASHEQIEALEAAGVSWSEIHDIDSLFRRSDAICMLQVQLPSFNTAYLEPTARPPIAERYRVTRDKILRAQRQVPILHVGPRSEELPESVDDLECVYYFDQVKYGMYLRAALLEAVIRPAVTLSPPA